jgi:pilus assembly protein CpaF
VSLSQRLSLKEGATASVVPLRPSDVRDRERDIDPAVLRPVLEEVRRRLSETPGTATMSDGALRVRVEAELASVMTSPDFGVSAGELDRVRSGILDEILGFGLLQDLLDDPEVSEIMVNGASNVYIESLGVVSRLSREFESDDQLIAVINRMVRTTGRRIDQTSPMVDARLPDGSRLNAVLPPLAVDGPSVTIRKFTANHLTVSRLVELGSLSEEAADLIQMAVEHRLNILVSGGTGTGKTTLLNVLSSFIDRDQRVITVEDAVELSLDLPNMIRLETRPANIEGAGTVTIRDLVRNALRMRPDRIVVGEIRGEEVVEMIHAMETGHDGSFSTCHANNPADALRRIETMLLAAEAAVPIDAVRRHLAACIDLVVHVERSASGHREIREIAEVHMLAPGAHDLSLRTLVVRGTPQYGPSRRPRAAHAAPFAWSAA